MAISAVDLAPEMARELPIPKQEWKFTLMETLMIKLSPPILDAKTQAGPFLKRLDSMSLLMAKNT